MKAEELIAFIVALIVGGMVGYLITEKANKHFIKNALTKLSKFTNPTGSVSFDIKDYIPADAKDIEPVFSEHQIEIIKEFINNQ